MPPKSGKKSGGADRANKIGEDERPDPLQALILADSFEPKFEPFTLEQPRCLLPLANTPLLEYTLQFLANAGVEEVFICCGNHTDKVEAYVKSSKWARATSPFSIEIVRSSASNSIGDTMRDIDQRGLLSGDFVCVYGDVVANVGMESAIRAHKQRREKSKNAIMTMVLREAGDQHRTQADGARPIFVVDPTKDRCLHYEQMRPGQAHPRLNIDGEILSDCPEVEIRADLIDCGIDICSPEVLSQWSDNFDWQQPRRGFLWGTLKDHELNGMTIHTHIATEGYAARVKSLQMYDAVSKDIVGRHTYPLCPDANLVRQQTYVVGKDNVYREDGVFLGRNSVVKKQTVLARQTSIGESSVISNSMIGKRCVIGKRCKIDGAYIWDDAKIGDDTVIERAIVANEAVIGNNCKVSAGALVSYKTVIADGTDVKSTARITRFKRKRGYEQDEIVLGQADPNIVGEGGDGFDQEPDSDEEEDLEAIMPKLDLCDNDDAVSISTLNSDDGYDSESGTGSQSRSHRADSFGSADPDESEGEAEARINAEEFHHEAAGSIYDSLQRGDSPDSIQLELKALTLSSNADGRQVRRAVAEAMMKRIAALIESGLPLPQAISETISPNRLLIERAVLDRDQEDNPESVEFLLFVQADCVQRPQGGRVLVYLCNALVKLEIFESEALEQWLEDERSGATTELIEVKKQTQDIMGGDSDEDDSSEEEDESEDESSEEE